MSKTFDRIAIDSRDRVLTRTVRPNSEARVGAVTGPAFRIVVRINSYQDQSELVVSRWSGSEWALVVRLSGAELTTWKAAKMAKTFTAKLVEDDIVTAWSEAEFITKNFQ